MADKRGGGQLRNSRVRRTKKNQTGSDNLGRMAGLRNSLVVVFVLAMTFSLINCEHAHIGYLRFGYINVIDALKPC